MQHKLFKPSAGVVLGLKLVEDGRVVEEGVG